MDENRTHGFEDRWLVDSLLAGNIIDNDILKEVADRNPESDYFFDAVTRSNLISEDELIAFVQHVLSVPPVDFSEESPDPILLRKVPRSLCEEHGVLPIHFDDNTVTLAVSDLYNLEAEKIVATLVERAVDIRFTSVTEIDRHISRFYDMAGLTVGDDEASKTVRVVGEAESDTSSEVVKLVNRAIAEALERDASDIHIEPKETVVSIRLRIDGVIQNIFELPISDHPMLVSRIKVISELDIAESRKPQDGKASVIYQNFQIDLRVSTVPTNKGEKIVIRILDSRKATVSFSKLGIRDRNLDLMERCFQFHEGIVLVTGPTGSGKSTTLYAALNHIKSTANNIMTVEDPVEYRLEGINQVQVNPKAGVTFASALRSFLRQDPDVILVGEIRDQETAEIAIQASLTGHLVLSTLHTNDTFATITRLIDMGIDAGKASQAICGVIAQRLVRRLCPECREVTRSDELGRILVPLMRHLNIEPKFYSTTGCANCNFSGYKGRIGVYEILLVDEEIEKRITSGESIFEVRKYARSQGFRSLYDDALSLIAEGITDYKEILRVINPKGEQALQNTQTPHVQKTPDVAADAEEGEAGPSTVLIVEDERSIRLLAKRSLQKHSDWEILEAEDGVKALEILKDRRVDAVILDLMMPKMDGLEFLTHLRFETDSATVPVLILTAMSGEEHEVKTLEAGADDYLTKPFNPKVLVARVKRLLNRKKDKPLKV